MKKLIFQLNYQKYFFYFEHLVLKYYLYIIDFFLILPARKGGSANHIINPIINDIKTLIESKDGVKSFIIDFGENKFLDKIGKTMRHAVSKKT